MTHPIRGTHALGELLLLRLRLLAPGQLFYKGGGGRISFEILHPQKMELTWPTASRSLGPHLAGTIALTRV